MMEVIRGHGEDIYRRFGEELTAHGEFSPEYFRSVMCHCRDVFVGKYNGTVIGVFGFVSPTLLSNWAYIWSYTPPLVRLDPELKRVFAIHSTRNLLRQFSRYERFIGECMEGDLSAQRWIKRLGGVFGTPANGLIPFTLEK